jgi:predicted transcriptional regulator
VTPGPSTADWKSLGVRVPPELAKALRILAAKKERTMQDILVEALLDVLKKHGEKMPSR